MPAGIALGGKAAPSVRRAGAALAFKGGDDAVGKNWRAEACEGVTGAAAKPPSRQLHTGLTRRHMRRAKTSSRQQLLLSMHRPSPMREISATTSALPSRLPWSALALSNDRRGNSPTNHHHAQVRVHSNRHPVRQ